MTRRPQASRTVLRLAALAVALLIVSPAVAALRDPKPVPAGLPSGIAAELSTERQALIARKDEIEARFASVEASCAGIPEDDTARIASCQTDAAKVEDDGDAYIRDRDKLEGRYVIASLDSLAANSFNWDAEERARLGAAFKALADLEHGTAEQARQVWSDVLARGQAQELLNAASAGVGPGFPGAGQQTDLQDCTIFALANATGRPYGWVAGVAAHLISQAPYREVGDRMDPEAVLERSGLNGGEVIMLAENFGQAEIVEVKDFPTALERGTPIMIDVLPPDGSGEHEVVLTKAFEHEGEIWYEVMDSNQGPLRRLYFRDSELKTVLLENGVAYRPESGTVPTLLRK
jgi:hypothetical protein